MKYTKPFFNLASFLILFTLLIYLYLARWIYYSRLLKIESIAEDDCLNQPSHWPFGSFLIHNSNYCKGVDNLEVLMLVHSAITHFENRVIIRNYAPSEHH